MSLARFSARRRRRSLALALLCVAGCSGAGLETPSTGAPVEREPVPVDEAPAEREPVDQPVEREPVDGPVEREPVDEQQVDEQQAVSEVEHDDACRAVVRRGDEIVLALATGQERVLDRNSVWDKTFGGVWAIGEYAIVGAPESASFQAPLSVAALALVHSSAGVLWRGTRPASDYTRAVGFRALTREGYVLLNDDTVIDPSGAEHALPEAGFVPVAPSIDEDGYVLVERTGELAYWNVIAGELELLAARGVGRAVTSPAPLDYAIGHHVAFVEETHDGALSLTRVSREEIARAPLASDVAERLRALLSASQAGEREVVSTLGLGAAALLVVDHRPAAWVSVQGAPHAFNAWSSLPATQMVRAQGGCFSGAPIGAATQAEVIAGLWRVHVDTGELEMGLRFALPAGLALEFPDPMFAGVTFPEPTCAGEGRMAVMLKGPLGSAWFYEADSGMEQLTAWGDPIGLDPGLLGTGAVPTAYDTALGRITRPFSWRSARDPLECELLYLYGDLLMIDHTRSLELTLADADAAFLGR